MTRSGLSAGRLARMHDVMAGHVERGAVPGVVTLVSRRGEVHVDAIGGMEAGGGRPMRRDTLFRITSMTKPVAAVAALMLVEECRLRLDDPVDELLPELADRRVLRRPDAGLDDTVPAHRPITLRDLLTMRMGFGLIFDDSPIGRAVAAEDLANGPPKPATPHDPDEWLRRFATLPLLDQPGERWRYDTAFAVLGVLVARAAGQPLPAFLRERIFEPLGMKDTGFAVPPDNLDRLPTAYVAGPDPGAPLVYDGVADSQWAREPAFPHAGNGLVSTVDDYLAFGRMLLEGGRMPGGRLLSRPTVQAMTTDQLTPEQRADTGGFLEDNRGWGLGVSVITKRDAPEAVPGRFGWDGGFGTSGYADPAEDLVAILMTQRIPPVREVYQDFWTCVYQSIDD